MSRSHVAKEAGLWIVSLFLALVCLRSGLTKLPGDSFWVRDFRRWGYPGWFRIAVGAAELTAFALLLLPRTALYGAALFAVVMVGAVFTHAAHHESGRIPFNLLLLSLSVLVFFARRGRARQSGGR